MWSFLLVSSVFGLISLAMGCPVPVHGTDVCVFTVDAALQPNMRTDQNLG
jgi:hypothetical protein